MDSDFRGIVADELKVVFLSDGCNTYIGLLKSKNRKNSRFSKVSKDVCCDCETRTNLILFHSSASFGLSVQIIRYSFSSFFQKIDSLNFKLVKE